MLDLAAAVGRLAAERDHLRATLEAVVATFTDDGGPAGYVRSTRWRVEEIIEIRTLAEGRS